MILGSGRPVTVLTVVTWLAAHLTWIGLALVAVAVLYRFGWGGVRRRFLRRTAAARSLAAKARAVLGYGDTDEPGSFVQWPRDDQATGTTIALRCPRSFVPTAAKVETLASTIHALAGGTWRAQHDALHDRLTFVREAPPRVLPDLVAFEDLLAGGRDRVPLGVHGDGRTLYWQLARPDQPHALVAGRTGSGKTTALRAIVAHQAGRADAIVDIIDAKRSNDFDEFLALPNVRVWTSAADMARVVCDFKAEMDRRYREGTTGPRRLLIIDEGADFVGAVKQDWSETKPRGVNGQPPALSALSTVLRQARAADLHVVEGCQQPNATVTSGTEGRAQFGFKLACGKLDVALSTMMFGDRQPPAVEPVAGRAVVDETGEFERVQLAHISPARAAEIAAEGRSGFTEYDERLDILQADTRQTMCSTPPIDAKSYEHTAEHMRTVTADVCDAPPGDPGRGTPVGCSHCSHRWTTMAKPGSTIRCPQCRAPKRVPSARSAA
ncbi:MAG: segregation ATPase FtsK/SpoIIIE, family [Pseudonocardiales bacterium]|nr:segregation ATPase FtsK/SpoIIIE, family [Pseudonocardiales bacterium]